MNKLLRALGAAVVSILVVSGLTVGLSAPSQAQETTYPAGDRRADVPVLSGSGVVGEPLTVLINGVVPLFPVQWLRDGTPISGETASTYVPGLPDIGHEISARVTLLLATVETLPITITEPPTGLPDLVTAPQLTGTPVVGELLTVVAPVFSLPGVDTTYQWLRDGAPIPGQTGDTYIPGLEDAGHELSVAVSSTLAGVPVLSTVTNVLPISGVGDQALSATTAPTVTGTAKIGKTLTVAGTEWNQDGVTTTYQWLRDGAPINGATSPSYTLVPVDLDSAISAKATGKKDGFTDGVVTSNSKTAVVGDPIAWTRQPAVSGTAKVGRQLTADPGAWGAGETPLFSYQWKRNGTSIPGAVAQTYQVDATDIGQSLTVTITAARAGYQPGTFTSPSIAVAKRSSTLKATLAKTRVAKSQRAALGVLLKVAGVTSPTGRVKVLDGKKVVSTLKLVAGKRGKATVRLPKLKPGVHKLTAVYAGTATIAGARSKVVKLTVTKH
jgi:hypothetical protein